MSKAANLLLAVGLLVAGLLMVTGLLDWVIRVVGVLCILAAVYFAYKAFSRRKRL